MMKNKRTGLLLFLIVSALLFSVKSSYGISFLNDKVRVTGYYENTTAWHTQDALAGGAGDLALCRNVFQLDTTIKLLDNPCATAVVHNIFRYFYEGSWGLDDDIIQRPKHRMAYEQGNDKNRELYLTVQSGRWRFSVGKQQLVWGESDLFRMADIINPLDLSYNYIWAPFKDTRIPLWMAVANYNFPGIHDMNLEVVYNPGDFKTWRMADAGGNWSLPAKRFFSMNTLGGFGGPPPLGHLTYTQTLDAVDFLMNAWRRAAKNHGINGKDWAAGGRLKGKFGGFDLSVFYYNGRSSMPSLYFANPMAILGPDALPNLLGSVKFKFSRQQNLGMTANYYSDPLRTVFRLETAYTTNGSLVGYEWYFPPSHEVTRDVYAFMLGFDRPTWMFWPKNNTWFISGQWFQKWHLNKNRVDNPFFGVLPDQKPTNQVSSLDCSRDKSSSTFTLIVNTFFGYGNRYKPQMLFMYDPSGNGAIWPSFSYNPVNWFFAEIGYQFMYAQSPTDGYMGLFRDNDQAYVQVKFSFD